MDSIDRTMKATGREVFDRKLEARRREAEGAAEQVKEFPADMVDLSRTAKVGGGKDTAKAPSAAKAKAGAAAQEKPKAKTQSKENAEAPSPEKEWTVLCYIDGNNDLEPYATMSLLDLESIGSTDNVNVVAELGRISQEKLKEISEKSGKPYEPTNVDGDWSGVRRYYVRQDDPTNPEAVKEINSDLVKNLKHKDMSDPATLGDFLIWGMNKYPAKHYLVVLMDHGGGWRGAFTDDASSEGGHIMKPQGIADALKLAETATGKKPDVVDMVACLMASGEMAYQMKDNAKYLVASEEMGTTAAFEYSPIIAKLEDKASKKELFTPGQLAKFLVDFYKDKPDAFVTKSAIDLEKMNAVKGALDRFAKALIKTKTEPAIIEAAIRDAQGFSKVFVYEFYTHFRDLHDIAENIGKNRKVKDPALKTAANSLMKAIESAVVANIGSAYSRTEIIDQGKSKDGKEDVTYVKISQGKFDSRGLSIYAPTDEQFTGDRIMKEYRQLGLSEDTKWDEFLLHHNKPEKPKKTGA